MTGKDLFMALNHVDDALIAEAETYAARKVIPMRTVRWVGALAACVCLLVCWAVAAQWDAIGIFGGMKAENAAMEGSTAAVTEGAVEQGAAAEEAETEDAAMENGAQHDGKTGAGTAVQEDEAHTSYQMTEDALIISGRSDGKTDEGRIDIPENGEWRCEENLRAQVAEQIRIQKTPSMAAGHGGPEVRFLAAFRLYQDGKEISADSAAYMSEIERLTGLGYEFRFLKTESRDKSVRMQVCGLFTPEQLDEFDAKAFAASAEYGYVFYFPEDENGQPLDWENETELCGLPTQADASVTKD